MTAVDVDANFDNPAALKLIVQRINAPAFADILAQEEQAISAVQQAELRRKKAELRKTMFADHEESIARLALTSRAEEAVTE